MTFWLIDDSAAHEHEEDRDPRTEDAGLLLVSAGALLGMCIVWALIELFK